MSRRKVSVVVAAAKKLRSSRMRPPLLRPTPGPPGRERPRRRTRSVRRRVRRATTHSAHRAFVNQIQPSGI
jgi:hypothetical protein